MDGWSASLTTMGAGPAAAAAAIDAAFALGRAALAARVAAAGARADHRARDIQTFVDDVNALRRSTFGALVTYAAEQRVPSDWPSRFFRRGHAPRRKATE